MTIWTTQPVDAQPSLTLVRWRIFKSDTNELHFVGYCPENYEGRVSSAIQNFDPVTQRGVTQSGRIYELAGPPGFDEDALYVWQRWLRVNNVPSCTDVTNDVATELTGMRYPLAGLQNH